MDIEFLPFVFLNMEAGNATYIFVACIPIAALLCGIVWLIWDKFKK
jgi:hypothetical protein